VPRAVTPKEGRLRCLSTVPLGLLGPLVRGVEREVAV
jgi:hypothetical protein